MSSEQRALIPYGRQWIDDSDIAAVVAALQSDFLTQGPAVEEFEARLANLTGAKYCVAFANATAALHVSVAALDLREGDEGITSPITFVASANCLAYNGLRPTFADIDDVTYCIDPADIERRIGSRSKVLIPVDFAGQPAAMATIRAIADRHGLYVIEDAAHAIGSIYPGGKAVGSCAYSDMTVFSFHPVKTITTGEGGAVTTNDPVLFRRLQLLRSHGITRDPTILSQQPGPWYYEMIDLGFNYRLTDLQAALGSSQLKRLPAFKARRKEIIAVYNHAFKNLPGLRIPHEAEGADSCFHLYVLRVDFEKKKMDRADVVKALRDLGVGTQVLYIPVHTQPYYRATYGYHEGMFPMSERFYSEALSIPLFPKMADSDVERVIQAVVEVVG